MCKFQATQPNSRKSGEQLLPGLKRVLAFSYDGSGMPDPAAGELEFAGGLSPTEVKNEMPLTSSSGARPGA
jgi:hypothetical protein